MEHLTQPESVLEHTGFVVMAAEWLRSEVVARGGAELDGHDVMTRALFHDFDELVTGDIPRPTKYSTPAARSLFEEIKLTSIDRVTEFLWPYRAFAHEIEAQHARAKEDAPGLIVAVADMLAVVYVVWREVILRGNLTMVRQAVTVRAQLEKAMNRIEASAIDGKAYEFLLEVCLQARDVAAAAAALDDPIHAAMFEQGEQS